MWAVEGLVANVCSTKMVEKWPRDVVAPGALADTYQRGIDNE